MEGPATPQGFTPLSLEGELAMIRDDDASHAATRQYVGRLTEAFLEKVGAAAEEERAIRERIESAFPEALQQYLRREHHKRGFKFSAYLMWWMYEAAKHVKPDVADRFD